MLTDAGRASVEPARRVVRDLAAVRETVHELGGFLQGSGVIASSLAISRLLPTHDIGLWAVTREAEQPGLTRRVLELLDEVRGQRELLKSADPGCAIQRAGDVET